VIKLVLFDLDGVLIDTKWIHYACLNRALGEYAISEEDHLNIYDGRKTTQKLQMLTERKGLPPQRYQEIYDNKQKYTMEEILKIQPRPYIVDLFKKLTEDGYEVGVCSNSIRRTVLTALAKSELMEYLSVIITNDDVKSPKPHPEMYWKAMSIMSRLPEETAIIEDSPQGLAAAHRSQANVIRVGRPEDVTIDNIYSKLTGEQFVTKWKDEKMNVLIPMVGRGSRFADAGYTFPKPLIDVRGKPMIQVVIENLGVEANFIYVVQKEHRDNYNLDHLLPLVTPGTCTIIDVDHITEGAACTALLAKDFINSDAPLLFANSDQTVDWRPIDFLYKMQEQLADGGIVTFKDTHPKWSFAAVDEETNLVTEVAEKKPISDNATAGYYYWKHGSDFVQYAERMIERDIRVNNEFYVAPVYNQAIEDGKEIRIFEADRMWGLGTPEDLEYYLNNAP
jgi:HAD superfamily hydrolase (TIGR01509 family)